MINVFFASRCAASTLNHSLMIWRTSTSSGTRPQLTLPTISNCPSSSSKVGQNELKTLNACRSYFGELYKSKGQLRLYRGQVHPLASNGLLLDSGDFKAGCFNLNTTRKVLRANDVDCHAELDLVLDIDIGDAGACFPRHHYCFVTGFIRFLRRRF